MLQFNLGCELRYNITQPSTFIFSIQPISNAHQTILQENLVLDPALNFEAYVAPEFGNRLLRVNAPAGKLQINYQATVAMQHSHQKPDAIAEIPPAELPLDLMSYLYPSRYCQSDQLMEFAGNEFGQLEPGYSRVTEICNWIYDNIKYLSGSSNQHTSAVNTVEDRAGVCRDFAHLGITLCRALNIPARFVSAYAYGLNPPDFHACFEAYLGDRWYLFDPTRLVPQNSIVRIGTGRDAVDVAFATIFGPVEMQQMQLVMEPVVGEASGEDRGLRQG